MAITAQLIDRQVTQLNAIAANAGTATVSINPGTDQAALILARVVMVQSSGGHLSNAAHLQAEFAVQNANGTTTAPAVLTSGINPGNSSTSTFVDARAEGSNLNAGGGAQPSAVWTLSSPNAVLTITNQSAATVDVVVFLEIYAAKNV